MKEILKEFFELLANSVIVICLIVVSFLLLVNLYHYRETSYVYNTDLNTNVKYVEVKTIISSIEEKVKKFPAVGNSINATSTLDTAKGEITKCLNSLKNSKYYTLSDTQSISSKDIYDVNMEFYTDFSNACLFYVGYHIEKSLNEELKKEFFPTYKHIEDQKKQILTSTEYMRDRLLANSAYGFTTEVTRNTTFNDRNAMLSMTILNYYSTVKTLEKVTDWCLEELGGAA